jgi:hypothetical protein
MNQFSAVMEGREETGKPDQWQQHDVKFNLKNPGCSKHN